YFDLSAYYREKKQTGQADLTDDQMFARQFIVEGEATLLMTAHAAQRGAAKKIGGEQAKLLETQMAALAGMSVDDLITAAKLQARLLGGQSASERDSVDKLDKIPRYVLVPLLESYTKGALPVAMALRSGGWEAVDALFREPPQSTEQVLHPAEK